MDKFGLPKLHETIPFANKVSTDAKNQGGLDALSPFN